MQPTLRLEQVICASRKPRVCARRPPGPGPSARGARGGAAYDAAASAASWPGGGVGLFCLLVGLEKIVRALLRGRLFSSN